MSDRRRFLARGGCTLLAVAAAGGANAPNVIAQPKVQWRLSTAWTPALGNQAAAQRLVKVVEEISAGRFRIEVFPGGQIMPPFECFDAAAPAAPAGCSAAEVDSPPFVKPLSRNGARGVVDRLLAVLMAMLASHTLYDPDSARAWTCPR